TGLVSGAVQGNADRRTSNRSGRRRRDSGGTEERREAGRRVYRAGADLSQVHRAPRRAADKFQRPAASNRNTEIHRMTLRVPRLRGAGLSVPLWRVRDQLVGKRRVCLMYFSAFSRALLSASSRVEASARAK